MCGCFRKKQLRLLSRASGECSGSSGALSACLREHLVRSAFPAMLSPFQGRWWERLQLTGLEQTNKERCPYSSHCSDGETLVKKNLVAGTHVLNWTPGPESGLLPGLAPFSLPALRVMTHFRSCLRRTHSGNSSNMEKNSPPSERSLRLHQGQVLGSLSRDRL